MEKLELEVVGLGEQSEIGIKKITNKMLMFL